MAEDSVPAGRRRGRKTPNAIRTCVIAGVLAGKNGAELDRETGLARSTIRRIVSDSEVQPLLASYRDQILHLVPLAIAVCARNLRSRSNASWHLAVEILKGTQVLIPKQQTVDHHVVDELDELIDEQLKEYALTGKLPAIAPGKQI